MTKMKFFPSFPKAIFALGIIGANSGISAQENAEDADIYELSPFTVDAAQDEGYIANNTLAGSRLNTALIDTPAAIDVMTVELIQDIGATTLEEALEYTVNADNDIGVSASDNSGNSIATRVNIRGLAATRARNYFPVITSTDTYNISRIEEQRGPNSILFGIGTPAGIINVNTKRAILGASIRDGSLRINSAGGYRSTIDANLDINDSFAIRVNAVYSDLDDDVYQFAYKKAKALHLAATVKFSEKVSFRSEVEWSNQSSVTSKTRPLTNRVSNWLEASRPTVESLEAQGIEDFSDFGISNFNRNPRVAYVDNDNSVINFANMNTSSGSGILFEENYPELTDRSINNGGPGQRRENDFLGVGGALDIQLGDQTFLELAVNHLETDGGGNTFSTDQGLRGSPNEFLSDGVTPHIGAGLLYLEGQWRRGFSDVDYTSYRATLSHEMDFDKWGNYRFALMYEIDDEERLQEQHREVWVDASGMGLFHSDPRNSRNRVYRRHYLFEEGNWKDYHVSSPVVDGLVDGMTVNTGEIAYSAWRNQNSGQFFINDFETAMIGLQARYFDERLVLGLGYREDKLIRDTAAIRDENNSFFFNEFGERVYNRDVLIQTEHSGDTKTTGAVFHVNNNLRLLFNTSDNFGLPSTSRFEYPDNGTAKNTTGEGVDFGLGFSFMDNKVSGRLTRFETDSTNIYRSGLNLTNINDALLAAVVANEDVTGVTQAQADSMFITGTGGIVDQSVEGYEFSVTANLTDNWRLSARYSYTDGFQSNSYPDQREYRDGDPDGRLGGFGGLTFFENPAWADLPLSEEDSDTIGEFIQDFKDDLAEELAVDGVALERNRPHKGNIFTRYNFSEGKLKGLFVGGGFKYSDGSQLGIGFDENGNAFALSGNSYKTSDLLLGYNFKELFGLDRVSIQLNVTNLFDFDDYIVTGRNVTTGEITRVTYLRPRAWSLTTRFSF